MNVLLNFLCLESFYNVGNQLCSSVTIIFVVVVGMLRQLLGVCEHSAGFSPALFEHNWLFPVLFEHSWRLA